jgi:pyrroline-5-carboxylate reductase
MRIGILGTGMVGRALAEGFIATGTVGGPMVNLRIGR